MICGPQQGAVQLSRSMSTSPWNSGPSGLNDDSMTNNICRKLARIPLGDTWGHISCGVLPGVASIVPIKLMAWQVAAGGSS